MVAWNCQSLTTHLNSELLRLYLSSSSAPLIMAFTETHWRSVSDRNTDLQPKPIATYQWSCYHSPTTGNAHPGGGLALLYHPTVAIARLPNNFNLTLPTLSTYIDAPLSSATLWHLIHLPNIRTFLLGIFYLSPQDVVRADIVKMMTSNITAVKSAYPTYPLLAVGDFNLKHRDLLDPLALPSTYSTQSAALHLANYIQNEELTILNNIFIPGQVTRPAQHLSQTTTGSIIDLALTDTPNLISGIHLRHSAQLSSDHLPLTLTFTPPRHQCQEPPPISPRVSWNYHAFPEAWKIALPEELDMALTALSPQLQLLQAQIATPPTRATPSLLKQVYHSFITIFIATCNRIIGMKQSNIRHNHWFTFPGIKAGYKALMAVRHRYPKNRQHPNRRTAESKWDKLQTEAKLHQWETLCNNLGCSSTTNNPLQWQHFKRVTPSSHAPLTFLPRYQPTTPYYTPTITEQPMRSLLQSSSNTKPMQTP